MDSKLVKSQWNSYYKLRSEQWLPFKCSLLIKIIVAYLLGVGEVLSVLPECHNSVNNSTGTCTLLDKCPGIHSQLIDMEAYKKHFCELEQ